MRVIRPSYLISYYDSNAIERIESIGRICYKSEDRMTDESGNEFVRMLIRRGHEAMLEHASISVRFIHNRGFSHELVRHRLAAYAQESTRYCNYANDKFGSELTFIEPYWYHTRSITPGVWYFHMQQVELVYLELIKDAQLPPQAARGILPNDIKTEIVMTTNVREWRHVLKLRTSKAAHPDMHRVMVPLLEELKNMFPPLFGDIESEVTI